MNEVGQNLEANMADLIVVSDQDEKQILPHQEVTEAINLGTKKERREVKIKTTLSSAIERRMCIGQAKIKKDQARN